MPLDYERPPYKSNQDRIREAENKKPQPRTGNRIGDSDNTKITTRKQERREEREKEKEKDGG